MEDSRIGCGLCASTCQTGGAPEVEAMKKALEEVPGVERADVDLDAKRAMVTLSEDVADETLIEAVVKEDYEASMEA